MNSPISIPVLAILLIALALSYCAGAYAQGVAVALCLIASGILTAVAVFMEASEAYAMGVGSQDDEGGME
jgi:hypothetical protein